MIILFLTAGVFCAGCGQKSETIIANTSLKGVSLSPRSTSAADFTDFFDKSKQTGSVVSWAGDWIELTTTEGAPMVLAGLAETYGYVPIIEAQFFTQSSGALLRPLEGSTRESYKNSAADFAEKYNLKYLGLGIEVNTLYEKSTSEFDSFVSFFSEVYDAVKAKSPSTKVFTIFQLEKMKGMNGGLFGGTNDPTQAQWSLLDSFPKSDLIALTTYPGLIYKSPSEIPTDYYSEIKSHTSKPVAFTEIGWHSEATPEGWESGETEQAEFIAAFFNLTKDLNQELNIWSFMYDPDTVIPFDSMGLRRRSDGAAKPAWDSWITR